MTEPFDRREFLLTGAAAGLGLALGTSGCGARSMRTGGTLPAPTAVLFAAPALETVRIGFVGVGNMGTSHVQNFLNIEGVEITAICDVNASNLARAQELVVAAGRPRPEAYSGGPEDFRRLCDRPDLDLVFTATPWEWHAPICLAAMERGKHAATEVPMAVTVDECWQLVETAERTRRHCVMMENCCYDRAELMILNMVRQGVFGELLHAECGYLHDLRALELSPTYYQDQWRVQHSTRRNGDLYPTHGLGPVAQWLNINRGNQFDYLVSMASPSRGLNLWAMEHIAPDSPEAKRRYALGDVVNTLIRTQSGQTILVTHDVHLPRPYSRRIVLQGTAGLVRKYPEEKIHLENRSPEHRWEDLEEYRQQYEHPLWTALQDSARGFGHGGMDYIEDFRLIQSLRAGTAMDMDVYDGAAWSSISELSERSIASGSTPITIPDFTRGAWQERPALGIVPG